MAAATKPQIRSLFATPVAIHFLPVAQEVNQTLRPLILEKAQAGNNEEGWNSGPGFESWGADAAQTIFRVARDLADAARESDFLRLVGDIVTARQSEDTFKTFREAGRQLGIDRLAEIGEKCERDHDRYADDANRLVQQMFVEHARGAELAANVQTKSAQAEFGR